MTIWYAPNRRIVGPKLPCRPVDCKIPSMTLPDLGAWLRKQRAPDAKLTLPRAAIQATHDELQRLTQSSDRMRKQNAKLRKRIARLKAGEPDTEPEATDEPDTDPEPGTEATP